MDLGVWTVSVSNETITIVGIYHPPPNEQNTHAAFLNEFIRKIDDVRTSYSNLIILGDLNIHVNNSDDIDLGQFLDTIEALGLKQHVNFPTHRDNNTLDLILSDATSSLKPIYSKPGPYLSDHCTVSTLSSIKCEPITIKDISFQNWKNVDPDRLIKDMELQDVAGEDLDQLLLPYSQHIQSALDIHAPIIPVKATNKISNPWYNKTLHKQLRTVRNRERIWRKYKQDHQWCAFKQSAYEELEEEEKEGKSSSESIESYFTLFELLLAPKSNQHFAKQGSITSGVFHSHIVKITKRCKFPNPQAEERAIRDAIFLGMNSQRARDKGINLMNEEGKEVTVEFLMN